MTGTPYQLLKSYSGCMLIKAMQDLYGCSEQGGTDWQFVAPLTMQTCQQEGMLGHQWNIVRCSVDHHRYIQDRHLPRHRDVAESFA